MPSASGMRTMCWSSSMSASFGPNAVHSDSREGVLYSNGHGAHSGFHSYNDAKKENLHRELSPQAIVRINHKGAPDKGSSVGTTCHTLRLAEKREAGKSVHFCADPPSVASMFQYLNQKGVKTCGGSEARRKKIQPGEYYPAAMSYFLAGRNGVYWMPILWSSCVKRALERSGSAIGSAPR